MKKIQYYAMMLALAFATQACSSEETIAESEGNGVQLEAIEASMDVLQTPTSRATTQSGFSVNTEKDPTFKTLAERGEANWKMDLDMYNNNVSSITKYDKGSFTGAIYSTEDNKYYWTPVTTYYFPNYFNPQVEAWIYPTTKDAAIETEQSTENEIYALDHLHKKKGNITIAHKPSITVHHQHAMLDFVIKDITPGEISEVTVTYNGKTYTPYPLPEGAAGVTDTSLEYMVILPEAIDGDAIVNPVVNIKTKVATGTIENVITYQQTIGIKKNDLGENQCYCFTLQGLELKISPVTVINWTTGESLPGEYIAVTAYPTFKAASHANETYYFYYDSKFGGYDTTNNTFMPYLQKITFNENGECTIKADGRILTHILPTSAITETNGKYTATDANMAKYALADDSKVTLGQMVVDIDDRVGIAKTK